MRIANPIYDTLFEYLMEDNQLAKLLWGGLWSGTPTLVSHLGLGHPLCVLLTLE